MFSLHHTTKPNIVSTKLLSKDDDNNAGRAWHRAYQCSSVKTCQYRDPQIFAYMNQYNRVDPQFLYYSKLSTAAVPENITEALKKQTQE